MWGCRLACCVVLGLVVAAPVVAMPELDLEWFEAQWSDGIRQDLPVDTLIVWEDEMHAGAGEEQLAQLELLVTGKPDHPSRGEYDQLKRRLEQGPDRREYRLWHGERDRFRLCCSFFGDPLLSYNDTVVSGDVVWMMNDRQLFLSSRSDLPDMQNPYAHYEVLEINLHGYRANGLRHGPRNLTPTSFEVDGNRWNAAVVSEDGLYEYAYEGWLASDDEGVVRAVLGRSVVTTSPDDRWTGAETRYAATESPPPPDGLFINTMTRVNTDGFVYQSNTLVSMEPITRGEMREYLATPSANAEDPIRGGVTFTTVNDSRSGSTRVAVADDHGRFVDIAPEPRSSNRIWKYGAVAFGVLATVLLTLKAREFFSRS